MPPKRLLRSNPPPAGASGAGPASQPSAFARSCQPASSFWIASPRSYCEPLDRKAGFSARNASARAFIDCHEVHSVGVLSGANVPAVAQRTREGPTSVRLAADTKFRLKTARTLAATELPVCLGVLTFKKNPPVTGRGWPTLAAFDV